MSGLKQSLSIKQLQKLSPQQIQMIKLLELPTMQLEQRVRQEVEENPVLEEQTGDENDERQSKEVSVEDYFKEDDVPSYKSYINNHSRDDKTPQTTVAFTGLTLQEYLTEQVRYKSMDSTQLKIVLYLIGNLDDDGYMRRDMQAVSDDIAFGYGVELSLEEVENALKILQSLEPPGIGARDLRECLLLQLQRYDEPDKAQRLAIKIISQYFNEFSKKHYDKLMMRLGVSQDEFRDAIEEIQRLSPKPGNMYNGDGADVVPYVTPDFILDVNDGLLDVRLTSYNIPELRVNKQYADMIRKMSEQSYDDNDRKETLQFIKNKIDSAKWFIQAIKQRRDTLMITMKSILAYQKEYFQDGDVSKLRPMILKDIADLTGLDVSTISRVVSSKYIQTPFGLIPLKQLFSEAMQTDSGEEVSAYEVKSILQESIDAEDKQRPLTDEELMNILNEKGYRIARRTVAKYREMLGIPVARLRKEL